MLLVLPPLPPLLLWWCSVVTYRCSFFRSWKPNVILKALSPQQTEVIRAMVSEESPHLPRGLWDTQHHNRRHPPLAERQSKRKGKCGVSPPRTLSVTTCASLGWYRMAARLETDLSIRFVRTFAAKASGSREGSGRPRKGKGRPVKGRGKAVEGQGQEVDDREKAVGGEGQAAEGRGKAMDGQGEAVEGQGKAARVKERQQKSRKVSEMSRKGSGRSK